MLFEDRKICQAAGFYAISLYLALLLALSAPFFGRSILLLTMFTPAVAVIVCRVLSPEDQRLRFSELGLSRTSEYHRSAPH